MVDSQRKLVFVPYNKQLASLIPEHAVVKDRLMLPHTHDVVKLARNLGVRLPAPISSQYDWNGDVPFKTQKITAAMLTMNSRAYVLSEMGTGKTRAALHAINFMIQSRVIRSALIVAPLSTLTTVWEKEIFRYFNHLTTGVLHGSREKRLEVLSSPRDIYIINHDGIKSILKNLAAYSAIDCVVVDELAAFRNARTDRWKALSAVLANRRYAWGLTGSPTPNAPADAWAQTKLLTPGNVPKFYKTFKEATMMQVSTFRWLPRKDANDQVFAVMQPAVRFTRDDCVELPPTVFQNRDVPMSAEQDRVYKRLMRDMKVLFTRGEVTAANEGVLMSKLLQTTTGWIYTRDKKVIEVDNSPRMDALKEVLDEAAGKVIVFVDFKHASKEIAAILTKEGYSVAQVDGDTPKKERDRIFGAFQGAEFPRIIVAHPGCMAHGLTLTEANVIVWFSPSASLDTYEQACARITRPGQKRTQLILHLTGTAVESRLYKRLQQKASLQGALLEMFE
jgi:SNF2 family DNA or RNA helicase